GTRPLSALGRREGRSATLRRASTGRWGRPPVSFPLSRTEFPSMSQAPFVIQQRLTAITMTYRNQQMVADLVLPRVPIDSPAFKYSKYTLADGFTIPDTRVGRKSAPNVIDWTATEVPDQTIDYGLDDAIPNSDVQAAQAVSDVQGVMPIDPEARSTMLLSDLVALDRENRVAGVVFNLNTYPAA